jgi:hydroxymethylpyrimidine pyrophosphatase-like HAD family hydrolase
MFDQLQVSFPQICESSDNQFRLTDWTFDVQGLSLEALQQMERQCHSQGWGFTYSTVQCHIKPLQQDKAVGLQTVLQRYFPQLTAAQIVTLGDSPNDQSLFDPSLFPTSVGVANLRRYANQMAHLPAYLTQASEAAGFCELASCLLSVIPAPPASTPLKSN